MELEGSLLCSQELTFPRPCVTLHNKLVFYAVELLVPCPTPQAGELSLITTIHCIHSIVITCKFIMVSDWKSVTHWIFIWF